MAGRKTSYCQLNLSPPSKRSQRQKAMLDKLSAQNRFALAFRIHNLKTEAGRKKKIAEFVAMLARGETIYPQRQSC